MAHGFKVGDRVRNGAASATVIALIADDALRVLYDGDDEPTTEIAAYFRPLEVK